MNYDKIRSWIEEQREELKSGAQSLRAYQLCLRAHLTYEHSPETTELLKGELDRAKKAEEEEFDRMMRDTT